MDLVWDRYIEDSLKGTARAKRGKGVRAQACSGIPGNWHDFLHVDRNKTELFHFLSKALFEAFNQQGKQLVVTDGESILSKPLLHDPDSLSHMTTECCMVCMQQLLDANSVVI